MTSFTVRIAHSVTEIGQMEWDQLSSNQPFASYRWFRYGEMVLMDCPPTHIILSHDGQPVARASFWLKRKEWLPFRSSPFLHVVESLLQKRPLFMCAAPLASAPALILPEPSLRAEALETIANLALEMGREHKSSLTFFGYTPASVAQEKTWPKEYLPISLTNTDTCLVMNWADFDSYLKHLAQSTRRNYKLHGKQAAEMGISISAQADVPEPERSFELIQAVESHHRMSHRPWTKSILDNIKLIDSAWITARVGSKLVGCCLLVSDGDVCAATLLGLDYSIPQAIYIYYQIMYAVVRYAIENKAIELRGGDGAYEFKRRLGFQTLPEDYMMVAAHNRLLRLLVNGMSGKTGEIRRQEAPGNTGC